jgi:hypothetical protein
MPRKISGGRSSSRGKRERRPAGTKAAHLEIGFSNGNPNGHNNSLLRLQALGLADLRIDLCRFMLLATSDNPGQFGLAVVRRSNFSRRP